MNYTNLDILKNKLTSHELQRKALNYKDTDVRKDFFAFIQSVLNHYYQGMIIIALCTEIKMGRVSFEEEAKEGLEPHLKHLLSIVRKPYDLKNYRNMLNQSLINGSWSIFETCLNAILTHALDDTKLHEFIYGKIPEKKSKKVLKPSKSKVADKQIWKKYDKVFELVNSSYGRDIQKDREFLEFFGNKRNGMHTNYIHYGECREYSFKGITHCFKPERGFTTSATLDGAYYFDMALELTAIYKEIATNINYSALIPYPDPNAPML